VVLGDPTSPEKIIEVVWENDHVGVVFFDRLQRQAVHYSFRRIDDKTMFLTSITNWQYPDDNAKLINESCRIESIDYQSDGIVEHEVRDKQADEIRRTKYRDVNTDINWEPVPTFGDWASITRFERDKPPARENE